jgi:TIR domain
MQSEDIIASARSAQHHKPIDGLGMNNTVPYLFFFSYSRADWEDDVYLERFFADLERRVAGAKGVGARKVGFRDEEGVKTGDDWNTKISDALQSSRVLVCIYTPNFFSPERAHEFCAKEFMAFLKRNPALRYDREIDLGNYRYQVRGARNILPILWVGESELAAGNKLPPYAVRTIQYTLNQLPDALSSAYREKGMSLITTRRLGTYRQLVAHLARRIVELSDDPLPPLVPPPDVKTLRSAFWDPPEEAGPDEHQGGTPEDAEVPLLGPTKVLGLELRPRPLDATHWAPYPGPLSLHGLVEAAVQSRRLVYGHQLLDPGAADFAANIWTVLEKATADNVRPILFIHPASLGDPQSRAALVGLMSREWRGGVVLPVDASDAAGVAMVERFEATLQPPPNRRNWIVIRSSATTRTIDGFRTAVLSVASEILARIVEHADVRQPPAAGDGPPNRPRIANTLDAERRV